MRKIILTVIFVLGLLYVVGSMILMFVFGFTFGNLLGFSVGSLCIGFYFLYPLLSSCIKLFLKVSSLFILAIFGGMVCFIIIKGAQKTTTSKEDSVLVLGCGIKGEKVLPLLQA